MHTQYEYILVLIKGVAYQTSLAWGQNCTQYGKD